MPDLCYILDDYVKRVQHVMFLQDNRHNIPWKERQANGLPDFHREAYISLALVLPFVRDVLGYDVFDLNQVIPEYPSPKDSGPMKKVDYAIMRNAKPIVIIECKPSGTAKGNLSEIDTRSLSDNDQLGNYFEAIHAGSGLVGIYTNGLDYYFYTDCDTEGTMDREPFLLLDCRSPLTDKEIEDLAVFVDCLHCDSTNGALREWAYEVKSRKAHG